MNMSSKVLSIILLSGFLIVQFLFFIDEGFYDFRWMKSAGNWFVFFIYWLGIFICQILLTTLLLIRQKSIFRIILGIFFGAAAGIYLLIKFIF